MSLKQQGEFVVTKKDVCSLESFEELSKKWALRIIKSMFMGCKRFNDFITAYEGTLSNRVLSDQLKRLEQFGYIKKVVVSTSPLIAEYHLTEMGKDLNKIIYEQARFAEKYGLIDRKHPIFKGRSLEEIFDIKQINDASVPNASSGEVGINIDGAANNGDEIFVKAHE